MLCIHVLRSTSDEVLRQGFPVQNNLHAIFSTALMRLYRYIFMSVTLLDNAAFKIQQKSALMLKNGHEAPTPLLLQLTAVSRSAGVIMRNGAMVVRYRQQGGKHDLLEQ